MQEALFYKKLDDNVVICELCPHNCRLNNGKVGICGVRINKDGILNTETYGVLSALHFDPIEKKPLYHFHPGRIIFSIGTVGCNLNCKFCQNCDISQVNTKNFPYLKPYIVQDIVKYASHKTENLGIAYTYNEPVVFFEFMLDIAKEAKANNLKNVVVSNGFINQEPLVELVKYIDAFNIDLKGFNDSFYKKNTGGSVSPVLETIKYIKSQKKHIEITNLVIPTLNDDKKEFEEMVKWIASEVGKDTVFHISRYFPHYKMKIPETPIATLKELFQIASKHLYFVFIGNASLDVGNKTICNKCGRVVIERSGYYTYTSGLDINGRCINCRNEIISK